MHLLLIVLLLAASPALAAGSPTEKARANAQRYLKPCPAEPHDENQLCLAAQISFVWDYVSAMSGDYEDQKNVSYLLHHGVVFGTRGILRNNLESCAWQQLIVQSGNPDVSVIDLDEARNICGSLSKDEQGLAIIRAQRLRHDIRPTPARKLQGEAEDGFARGSDGVAITDATYPLGDGPPPRQPYRPKPRKAPLDGTAQPLSGQP